jgi:8-oxo-dGTP pyrophosphatase MutT (NUDIX family)
VEDADRGDLATRAVEWRGDPEELPWRAAALREFWEEAGVALTEPPGLEVQGSGAEAFESVLAVGGRFAGHRLFPITRWITPEGLPRRFDTRFYVADVGRESAGTRADGVEVFDDVWVDPETAIAREAAGEWEVPFPTMHHLELLRRHESVGSVIAYAGSLGEIPGVLPRVVLGENGAYAVLMPGDPGYDAEAAE